MEVEKAKFDEIFEDVKPPTTANWIPSSCGQLKTSFRVTRRCTEGKGSEFRRTRAYR
jgi:hypothetical protein